MWGNIIPGCDLSYMFRYALSASENDLRRLKRNDGIMISVFV